MYSNTATLSKRPSSKLPVESVSNGSIPPGRCPVTAVGRLAANFRQSPHRNDRHESGRSRHEIG